MEEIQEAKTPILYQGEVPSEGAGLFFPVTGQSACGSGLRNARKLWTIAGRYQIPARNTGSRIGSMTCLTTICATRSATVGTPKILCPPDFLGMETARTGGG